MKQTLLLAATLLNFTSAFAQSVVPPSPDRLTCFYTNHATSEQARFPCRVITTRVGGPVSFIDEYDQYGTVHRHYTKPQPSVANPWYAPKLRASECLLRSQGAESICLNAPWGDSR